MTLSAPGPMTPREAFSWARAALARVDPEGAALDARLLVSHAWGGGAGSIHVLPDVRGSSDQMARLVDYVQRRQAHEPVAYILGKKEFWSLEFLVTPAVLIPRPDSETLIRHALELLPDRYRPYRVLDLGTGSGCLLLAFLHERPMATGLGIDASAAALDVARDNARRFGMTSRTTFALGNWGENAFGRFDLILSNPPYISDDSVDTLAPDVRSFEPHSALFAGKMGLEAYFQIAPQLTQLWSPSGKAVIEVGAGQASLVCAILASTQGFGIIDTKRDLAGVERSIAVSR